MTDHRALNEASYHNLVRSLDTLAGSSQELTDPGRLFDRLRNLVIVLQSTGPVAIECP